MNKLNRLKYVVSVLLVGVLFTTPSSVFAEKKNKEETDTAQVSETTDVTSFSHWSLNEGDLNMSFTGNKKIEKGYEETYYIETEYGTFTLHNTLEDKGSNIISTLTNHQGEVVHSQTNTTNQNRDFDIALPTELLAHASETGLQVKIYDEDRSKEIIVSTANTIPDYIMVLFGLLIAGTSIFFLQRKASK